MDDLVLEALHISRKLNISRSEACRRLNEVMVAGGGLELPHLYAMVIRHETSEQWQNSPEPITEDAPRVQYGRGHVDPDDFAPKGA